MGLFKKLFAKQPGGSVFGNLLRGVGDKFTGGLYSSVFKAPSKDAPNRPASPASIVAPQPAAPSSGFMAKVKGNLAYVIGGIAGLGLILWLIFKPKKGYRR